MDKQPGERPTPDIETVRKELGERDREIEESEPDEEQSEEDED